MLGNKKIEIWFQNGYDLIVPVLSAKANVSANLRLSQANTMT